MMALYCGFIHLTSKPPEADLLIGLLYERDRIQKISQYTQPVLKPQQHDDE